MRCQNAGVGIPLIYASKTVWTTQLSPSSPSSPSSSSSCPPFRRDPSLSLLYLLCRLSPSDSGECACCHESRKRISIFQTVKEYNNNRGLTLNGDNRTFFDFLRSLLCRWDFLKSSLSSLSDATSSLELWWRLRCFLSLSLSDSSFSSLSEVSSSLELWCRFRCFLSLSFSLFLSSLCSKLSVTSIITLSGSSFLDRSFPLSFSFSRSFSFSLLSLSFLFSFSSFSFSFLTCKVAQSK